MSASFVIVKEWYNACYGGINGTLRTVRVLFAGGHEEQNWMFPADGSVPFVTTLVLPRDGRMVSILPTLPVVYGVPFATDLDWHTQFHTRVAWLAHNYKPAAAAAAGSSS